MTFNKRTSNLIFILGPTIFFSLLSVSHAYAENSVGAKKQHSETGLDPTEVVGRFEINYSFLEKDSGTERHSAVFVFDKDIDKRTVVGIDIPLTIAKPVVGDEQQGVGDVSFKYRRLMHKGESFSTGVGGSITLDTASDDNLGEGENVVTMGMMNAWHHDEWMIANLAVVKISDKKDNDAIFISPLLAYQPMAKYLSYVTVGTPVTFFIDTDKESVSVVTKIGKVMPNKDIYSLGTRNTVSGDDDTKRVIILGFRRLF